MHASPFVRVIYQRRPAQARLVLNRENLHKLRQKHGGLDTNQDLGHAIGIHPTQVSRVLHGGKQPGEQFIAGLLHLFGKRRFGDLFDIVIDSDDEQ